MASIKTIRTLSFKRNSKYEIRKEHVTFTDGTTSDRVWCYTLDGKPLGGIREAEKYFTTQVSRSPFLGRKPKEK